MVSMKDISAVCGVSVATVSKALNDQSDIGQETKKRIRKVAEEMGYFPNTAAKMLKTNRSYNIGVLFNHEDYSGLTHDYYAFVLDSLKNTVEEKGYDIPLSIRAYAARVRQAIWSIADPGDLTASRLSVRIFIRPKFYSL